MRTGPLSTTSYLQCACQHKEKVNSVEKVSILWRHDCISFSFWLISNIDLILGFLNYNYLFARGWLRGKRRCCFGEVIETSQMSHSWGQRAASSCQDSIEEWRKDMRAWWKSDKKQLKVHFKHMRINSLIKWTKRSQCVDLKITRMCKEGSRQHLGGQPKNL